jgi:N-succinyldiaminopimelate aminotransferase
VKELRDSLQTKRDVLYDALVASGLEVHSGGGTYYLCADITAIGERDGIDFCRTLPERVGVAAVPVSVFTDHPQPWNPMVRFAFCKQDHVLEEAARRLRTLGKPGS